MARDPYFNRLQHGSYLDRMVSARDVAWFRNPDGSFTVTWTDAGEPRAEIFKTERSALRFARILDTTGVLPTERDVLEAEAALRQLEKEVMTKEDREDQRLAMESPWPSASRTLCLPLLDTRPIETGEKGAIVLHQGINVKQLLEHRLVKESRRGYHTG